MDANRYVGFPKDMLSVKLAELEDRLLALEEVKSPVAKKTTAKASKA